MHRFIFKEGGESCLSSLCLTGILACSVFLAGNCNLYGQARDLDNSLVVCRYVESVIVDTLSGRIVTDTLVLNVGRNASSFFSEDRFFVDSLLSQPDGRRKFASMMSQYAKAGKSSDLTSNTAEYIYQNYPEGRITTRAKVGSSLVEFSEERTPLVWHFADSTKSILGYDCRMARTEFRGRVWMAWFTTDIPLNSGPWKLWGLPGLILEVFDKKREYEYTLVEIKTSEGSVILYDWSNDVPYKKVDRIRYLKALSGLDQLRKDNVRAAGLGELATERKYDLREKDYH